MTGAIKRMCIAGIFKSHVLVSLAEIRLARIKSNNTEVL